MSTECYPPIAHAWGIPTFTIETLTDCFLAVVIPYLVFQAVAQTLIGLLLLSGQVLRRLRKRWQIWTPNEAVSTNPAALLGSRMPHPGISGEYEVGKGGGGRHLSQPPLGHGGATVAPPAVGAAAPGQGHGQDHVPVLPHLPGSGDRGYNSSVPLPLRYTKLHTELPFRHRLWLWYNTTLLGRLWESSQFVFTVIALLSFVFLVYAPHFDTPVYSCLDSNKIAYISIETVWSVAFLLDVTLYVLLQPSLSAGLLSVYTLIDYLSLFPYFAPYFISGGPHRLLELPRSLRILRLFRLFGLVRSSFYRQLFRVILGYISMLFLFSAWFVILERYECAKQAAEPDPLSVLGTSALLCEGRPNNHLDFFSSVYFALISVTTVGYGEISPTGIPSRVLVFFVVVVFLSTIPFQTERLQELFRNRPQFRSARKLLSRAEYVVLSGFISPEILRLAIEELLDSPFRKSHNARLVVLLPWKLDIALSAVTFGSRNRHRVSFIQGSPLAANDLVRALVPECTACLLFADQKQRLISADAHDTYLVLSALSIIGILRSCGRPLDILQVQVLRSTAAQHLWSTSLPSCNVLVVTDLNASLLAYSAFVPGAPAFFTFLVRPVTYTQDLVSWLEHNQEVTHDLAEASWSETHHAQDFPLISPPMTPPRRLSPTPLPSPGASLPAYRDAHGSGIGTSSYDRDPSESTGIGTDTASGTGSGPGTETATGAEASAGLDPESVDADVMAGAAGIRHSSFVSAHYPPSTLPEASMYAADDEEAAAYRTLPEPLRAAVVAGRDRPTDVLGRLPGGPPGDRAPLPGTSTRIPRVRIRLRRQQYHPEYPFRPDRGRVRPESRRQPRGGARKLLHAVSSTTQRLALRCLPAWLTTSPDKLSYQFRVEHAWQADYGYGLSNSLRTFSGHPSILNGFEFPLLATLVYLRYGFLLVGVLVQDTPDEWTGNLFGMFRPLHRRGRPPQFSLFSSNPGLLQPVGMSMPATNAVTVATAASVVAQFPRSRRSSLTKARSDFARPAHPLHSLASGTPHAWEHRIPRRRAPDSGSELGRGHGHGHDLGAGTIPTGLPKHPSELMSGSGASGVAPATSDVATASESTLLGFQPAHGVSAGFRDALPSTPGSPLSHHPGMSGPTLAGSGLASARAGPDTGAEEHSDRPLRRTRKPARMPSFFAGLGHGGWSWRPSHLCFSKTLTTRHPVPLPQFGLGTLTNEASRSDRPKASGRGPGTSTPSSTGATGGSVFPSDESTPDDDPSGNDAEVMLNSTRNSVVFPGYGFRSRMTDDYVLLGPDSVNTESFAAASAWGRSRGDLYEALNMVLTHYHAVLNRLAQILLHGQVSLSGRGEPGQSVPSEPHRDRTAGASSQPMGRSDRDRDCGLARSDGPAPVQPLPAGPAPTGGPSLSRLPAAPTTVPPRNAGSPTGLSDQQYPTISSGRPELSARVDGVREHTFPDHRPALPTLARLSRTQTAWVLLPLPTPHFSLPHSGAIHLSHGDSVLHGAVDPHPASVVAGDGTVVGKPHGPSHALGGALSHDRDATLAPTQDFFMRASEPCPLLFQSGHVTDLGTLCNHIIVYFLGSVSSSYVTKLLSGLLRQRTMLFERELEYRRILSKLTWEDVAAAALTSEPQLHPPGDRHSNTGLDQRVHGNHPPAQSGSSGERRTGPASQRFSHGSDLEPSGHPFLPRSGHDGGRGAGGGGPVAFPSPYGSSIAFPFDAISVLSLTSQASEVAPSIEADSRLTSIASATLTHFGPAYPDQYLVVSPIVLVFSRAPSSAVQHHLQRLPSVFWMVGDQLDRRLYQRLNQAWAYTVLVVSSRGGFSSPAATTSSVAPSQIFPGRVGNGGGNAKPVLGFQGLGSEGSSLGAQEYELYRLTHSELRLAAPGLALFEDSGAVFLFRSLLLHNQVTVSLWQRNLRKLLGSGTSPGGQGAGSRGSNSITPRRGRMQGRDGRLLPRRPAHRTTRGTQWSLGLMPNHLPLPQLAATAEELLLLHARPCHTVVELHHSQTIGLVSQTMDQRCILVSTLDNSYLFPESTRVFPLIPGPPPLSVPVLGTERAGTPLISGHRHGHGHGHGHGHVYGHEHGHGLGYGPGPPGRIYLDPQQLRQLFQSAMSHNRRSLPVAAPSPTLRTRHPVLRIHSARTESLLGTGRLKPSVLPQSYGQPLRAGPSPLGSRSSRSSLLSPHHPVTTDHEPRYGANPPSVSGRIHPDSGSASTGSFTSGDGDGDGGGAREEAGSAGARGGRARVPLRSRLSVASVGTHLYDPRMATLDMYLSSKPGLKKLRYFSTFLHLLHVPPSGNWVPLQGPSLLKLDRVPRGAEQRSELYASGAVATFNLAHLALLSGVYRSRRLRAFLTRFLSSWDDGDHRCALDVVQLDLDSGTGSTPAPGYGMLSAGDTTAGLVGELGEAAWYDLPGVLFGPARPESGGLQAGQAGERRRSGGLGGGDGIECPDPAFGCGRWGPDRVGLARPDPSRSGQPRALHQPPPGAVPSPGTRSRYRYCRLRGTLLPPPVKLRHPFQYPSLEEPPSARLYFVPLTARFLRLINPHLDDATALGIGAGHGATRAGPGRAYLPVTFRDLFYVCTLGLGIMPLGLFRQQQQRGSGRPYVFTLPPPLTSLLCSDFAYVLASRDPLVQFSPLWFGRGEAYHCGP